MKFFYPSQLYCKLVIKLLRKMGNLCCFCCMVAFKYTSYSSDLADSILEKMKKKLGDIVNKLVKKDLEENNKGWSFSCWSVSLEREIFKQYKLTIIGKLHKVLKELSFPVLMSSGYAQDHLAENISQVLVSGLFDSEYFSTISGSYQCLDIPMSSIFYTCPKVDVDDNVLDEFKNYLTRVVNYNSTDEEDKMINIGLSTHDKAYHNVFDKHLEVKLLKNLNDLNDGTLSNIVSTVHDRFINLQEREKKVLNDNSNNFSAI